MRLLLALRAKLYLDGDVFFLISLREIRKKTSPSKEYFAAVGGILLYETASHKTCRVAPNVFFYRRLIFDFALRNQK